MPDDSNKIFELNINNDKTVTLIGDIVGLDKYASGVLSLNGYIYAIPDRSNQVLKIDLNLDSSNINQNLILSGYLNK